MPPNIDELGFCITKLTIENIACFKKRVVIPFTYSDGKYAKWTILLGENGMGKSTVLRFILITEPVKGYGSIKDSFFHSWTNEIESNSANLNLRDILTIRKDTGISIFSTYRIIDKDKNMVQNKLFKSGLDDESLRSGIISYTEFSNGKVVKEIEPISGFPSLKLYNNEYNYYPIFGYGANRNSMESKIVKFESKAKSLLVGNNSLFPADIILLHIHNSEYKPYFNYFATLLKESFLGIKDIEVEEGGESNEPKLIVLDAFNSRVPFSQISLGHQEMAAWLVDFAFRMLLYYPNSEDPFAEPAVCVVDEIDLHLHPKWQRKVFQFLEDRFPRTQFIVSAHSPLIVLSNPDANFVLLRNVDENDPSKGVEAKQDPIKKVEGYRLDQLLSSELFGLQSTLDPNTEREYLRKLNLQRRVTLGETLPPNESEELQNLTDALSEKGFVASSIDPLYNQFVTTLLKRQQQELISLRDISAKEVDDVLAEILG